MTLKINYLDTKKGTIKNRAYFIYQNTKTNEFKGEFEAKTNQEIINFFKKSGGLKNDKIVLLNQNFNEKIILIYIVKSKSELEFEKLGAKFYDFLKNNEINEVYINNIKSKNSIYFSSFLHAI